jgi:glycosyltransferase involved in cell wall biosynthesis
MLSLGKIGFGGLISGLILNNVIERQMNNPDIEIYEPVDTVSVVIPCYNEESFIETTLLSLIGQSIINEYPEYFEIVLANNNSTDNSVAIAENYVDKVINVNQKGKLYARNEGINAASGNIIVAADADIYFPSSWLNTLLEPFNNIHSSTYDANISGSTGSVFNPDIPGIPVQLYNIAQFLDKRFVHTTVISGANSAFWKHKYYQIGRFNENFNQMSINEMHYEEENKFGKELSKLGKIVYKLNASCLHLGGRRTGCRIGITNKDYCISQGIGIQRFG